MPPHERFHAWQCCHELVLLLYPASQRWPVDERFGLIAQIRRASVSAPSNIAEGATKRGAKEFCRYLDIANGSLAEVGYLLRLAKDLGYLSPEEWERLDGKRDEAGRSVWGLYASVRKRTVRT